jgi:hypothetical protein
MIAREGHPVVGFGQIEELVAPALAAAPSPITVAITTSLVGAATGWVLEEIVRTARGRRRRR